MKLYFSVLALLFQCILIFSPACSQVRLPKLISDGMVLQRGTELKIWGWASPDENIKIEFLGKSYSTKADKNSEWSIKLLPLENGGPFEMNIEGKNQIAIKNILIGDVWICSGQSNMELTMKRAEPIYQDIIENSENPHIRYLDVPDRYNFNEPHDDLEKGSWLEASPENVLNFSAVAYFFAKDLYEKYQVPIGLINASLGGSPVEAWISEDALKQFPSHLQETEKFKDKKLIQEIEAKDKAVSDAWYKKLRDSDLGYDDKEAPWLEDDVNTSSWSSMTLPGYWADEELGPVNGVVWFRKEIDVPASMKSKAAKLLLGRIVDSDSVFLNGTFVGTTGYQYPPRRYDIPANLLKEGKNTLVVRVISNSGKGGFVTDKPYILYAGKDTIDLAGEWKYKLGASMEPFPGPTFIRWKPVGLYNGMIAPLLNFSIKGVIWYQGESNTDNPEEYDELFITLIKDWRQKWGQGDFPFLYVQLANFMESKDQPSESNWAALREAQLKVLQVPNTAIIVAIDIGEWNDIHPLNKQDVGKRLALAAQKLAYDDKSIVYSGPIYKSMEIAGNKIKLSFNHIGSGLKAKGENNLKQFAIAGADKKFVWANAKIENDKVIVWSDQIDSPVAVRYAWADNPEGANLYNKEGLPATPFRTDNFELQP